MRSECIRAHHDLPRVRHFLVRRRLDTGGSDGHVSAISNAWRQKQLVHDGVPSFSRREPVRTRGKATTPCVTTAFHSPYRLTPKAAWN